MQNELPEPRRGLHVGFLDPSVTLVDSSDRKRFVQLIQLFLVR
jgi:hypothetical protein